MKFGKSLSNQIGETIPEWRDKFLSYKELKKRLKLIGNTKRERENGGEDRDYDEEKRPEKRQRVEEERETEERMMSREEVDFEKLLEAELEKFNTFFVEKEEEYIIRLKELKDRVAKAEDSNEEMMKIRKEIVDFHGEMVLLENYSALNYTGLVKILKKYDKRTGALIRLPFIQKVLQQPFFTTDLLYKLVKACEATLDSLFPVNEQKSPAEPPNGDESCDPPTASTSTNTENGLLKGPKELAEIETIESLYMKSTISALRALKEIRSGSSTVSMFSLPPLQTSGLDETWKKIPILEQVAK